MSTILEGHLINEAYSPSTDHEAWVAYLVLSQRYPKLTYWSFDGYHVHALADYTKDLVWRDNKVIKWSTREELETIQNFYDSPTSYITNTWVQIVKKHS